jgi:hypothetical protein
MARTGGEIVIGRPVDVVSGNVAGQSHEPQYDPQMPEGTPGSGGSTRTGADHPAASNPGAGAELSSG